MRELLILGGYIFEGASYLTFEGATYFRRQNIWGGHLLKGATYLKRPLIWGGGGTNLRGLLILEGYLFKGSLTVLLRDKRTIKLVDHAE